MKLEPSYIASGNIKWYILENISYGLAIPHLYIHPREIKTLCSHRLAYEYS